MGERNSFYIGNGNYLVYYKKPLTGKVTKFIGKCENFNTNGICAFWNEEKEQMLLLVYWDIVGLYPVEDNHRHEDLIPDIQGKELI